MRRRPRVSQPWSSRPSRGGQSFSASIRRIPRVSSSASSRVPGSVQAALRAPLARASSGRVVEADPEDDVDALVSGNDAHGDRIAGVDVQPDLLGNFATDGLGGSSPLSSRPPGKLHPWRWGCHPDPLDTANHMDQTGVCTSSAPPAGGEHTRRAMVGGESPRGLSRAGSRGDDGTWRAHHRTRLT